MGLTPAQRALGNAVRALSGAWGSQSHHRARVMASLATARNHEEASEDPAWI